jgi:hypothetical protein
MATLRQYADSEIINSITNVEIDDNKLISAAESQIDALVKELLDYKSHYNLPSFIGSVEFASTEITFGADQLTINSQSFSNNQFQFTVLELLEDSGNFKRGTRIPIKGSNNNVLTFDNTFEINNAIVSAIRISQVGVFPRLIDSMNSYKTIPYQLIEAVAWQTVHLKSQSPEVATAVAKISKKAGIKSESIGSGYSVTYGEGSANPKNMICQQALNLIDSIL